MKKALSNQGPSFDLKGNGVCNGVEKRCKSREKGRIHPNKTKLVKKE